MTENNKRYKVAIYDEKAISGYCVLDLENPSQTARLKYNNVFIGTKDGCNIVCDLLNEQDTKICALNKRLSEYLPMWVFEKVINRRIESTENEEIKKELKELLKELK